FKDDDGSYYMYFGGIWGGQLQRWRTGNFEAEGDGPLVHLPEDNEPALCPKIARLRDDLLEFAETPKDILIIDEEGKPLLSGDTDRRFFEASWVHKYKGKYYFSYSTGDTHFICYGIGDNPYGPFKYAGKILNPVVGWTSHHSICAFEGKWYLFYHDSSLSKGITHLRSIKVTELIHDENGHIQTIDPYSSEKK
ncbi:MAG: alpha-N-arabinofuranosidase, partial [Sphingobacteriales bacterium]